MRVTGVVEVTSSENVTLRGITTPALYLPSAVVEVIFEIVGCVESHHVTVTVGCDTGASNSLFVSVNHSFSDARTVHSYTPAVFGAVAEKVTVKDSDGE